MDVSATAEILPATTSTGEWGEKPESIAFDGAPQTL